LFSKFSNLNSQISTCFWKYYSYPRTECKTALAKQITDTWPHLGDTFSQNSKAPPYVLFFHPEKLKNGNTVNRGKIEYKLQRLAKKLPQQLKKNAKRGPKKIKPDMLALAAANIDLVSHYIYFFFFVTISFVLGYHNVAVQRS
jgi:hypothetical protein